MPTSLSHLNRIKDVLSAKQLTQILLCGQLGKSYNMVNSYVQYRRQPKLELMFELADVLNVDVKELIVSNKTKHAGKTSKKTGG